MRIMATTELETREDFVTFTAGGMLWRITPECRSLFGPDGLRLPEWIASGQARIIKTGPHCTVYRVVLPGIDFYLKHYRLFNTQAWLRQMIRPAKARSEFERGVAVRDHGINTVPPLGFGEHVAMPGDSFLLTRTVEAEPLGGFIEMTLPSLPSSCQRRIRTALAEQLGIMMAKMHAAGVVHHDLHAGNLLVRLDRTARPELLLIDLHAVRVGTPLGWAARSENLVMLNRWFVLRSDRTDRLRFWRAYAQTWRGDIAMPCEAEHRRQQCRALESDTWTSNLAFWRNRDRRCRANNRYYRKVRGPGGAGFAMRDLDPEILAPILRDPDAPFDGPGVKLLKDSPSATVALLEMTVGGEVRRFVYKRFAVTHWSDPLTALVRSTPALRSWVLGHGLRERGLPTPRPLLVLHRQRHRLCREGYLLTEMLPDAVDLRTYLDGLVERPAAERRAIVRRLIPRLARLALELHRRHLSQRDLKSTNLILSSAPCPWSAVRESDATGPHIWLIDLVGVSRHGDLGRHRRVKNLARLHASFLQHAALTRTDRLRFLRVYLRWGLLGKIGWKRWWHEVTEVTKDKVARNRRNGRMLG
jgi:tRNA A-37 threonylcarbamoyl transferase component Bud32